MREVEKSILTNFAGECEVCHCHVHSEAGHPERGWAVKFQGEALWHRYCKRCVPIRKGVRKLTADGRIVMPYEEESLPILRSLPGAYFERSGSPVHWRVSLAPHYRMRLLEVASQLNLDVAPELRWKEQNEQTLNAAAAGLWAYQVYGVEWLSEGLKRFLGDDMGLGKTVQTLVSLSDQEAVLVVCPANAKYNWEDETKLWKPHLRPVVLEGKESFRLPEPGELVITNYDILPEWLIPVPPGQYVCGMCPHKEGHEKPGFCPECKNNLMEVQPWHYRPNFPEGQEEKARQITLVVDEAQLVKNVETARAKKVLGLSTSVKKVIGLTGTPIENRPPDLFGVLTSLNMLTEVFGNWKHFVQLMGGVRNARGKYDWGKVQPEVPELLRRVMLRRIRADVLKDLPPVIRTTIKVDVPKPLRKNLDSLWGNYGSWLQGVPMEKRKLPPFEEFSTIRQQLAASRIKTVLELVQQAEESDTPLVVFSSHLKPLDILGERPGWAKITGATPAKKRQEIVRAFQAGKLKGVACSIRAGGVAITLTRAWKMIFIDQDWNPGVNRQAIARILRFGQKAAHVEIVYLVSTHILDLHMFELLEWKTRIHDAAIDGVTAGDGEGEETEAEFVARMRKVEENFVSSA